MSSVQQQHEDQLQITFFASHLRIVRCYLATHFLRLNINPLSFLPFAVNLRNYHDTHLNLPLPTCSIFKGILEINGADGFLLENER